MKLFETFYQTASVDVTFYQTGSVVVVGVVVVVNPVLREWQFHSKCH